MSPASRNPAPAALYAELRGCIANNIYTKEGRPLNVSGNDLISRSGKHVARIRGHKAYGPDGTYVGTVVGDRLIYRSTDSAAISSPFAPRAVAALVAQV